MLQQIDVENVVPDNETSGGPPLQRRLAIAAAREKHQHTSMLKPTQCHYWPKTPTSNLAKTTSPFLFSLTTCACT